MPLFLSVPEALSQCPQVENGLSTRQLWTIPLIDATGKSQGYRQVANLRPGLNVLIDDYTLQDDLIVETGNGKPRCPDLEIEMSFMLSGHNRQEKVQPCHNFFSMCWCDVDGGKFSWKADERVLKFDIHINPTLFETLVGKQFGSLPSCLRRTTQQTQLSQEQFRHTQPTTAAMQAAIHQILHCPYQGLTRWLYWESKVLELIALRLDSVSQHPPAAVVTLGLQAEDIDRIYHAKDILTQQLDNPPSLVDLARQVGLNDCTLKRQFRQVFGTTVFGYLHHYRMEQAQALLLKNQLSINAIARAVGYTNPCSFSTAFRKKFGVSPKTMRQ
ncbi:MAG: AraC family transcriptional regulator [Cyanobacteria bacterium P01_A01_bin.37]